MRFLADLFFPGPKSYPFPIFAVDREFEVFRIHSVVFSWQIMQETVSQRKPAVDWRPAFTRNDDVGHSTRTLGGGNG